MFRTGKYNSWYNRIIEGAQKKGRTKNDGVYYENHHILPKSLGGSNRKDNMVLLTPKEHFVCHRLLCKMVIEKNHVRLMNASLAYFTNNAKRKLPSRCVVIARRYNGLARKGVVPWNKGIPHTDETKRKIGVKNSRKTLTEDGRKKKSDFTKNNNPMDIPKFAEKARVNHSKYYKVTDPQGKVYMIRNLAEFCRDNSLNKGNMCSVSKGNLNHYRGWKCEETAS